MNKITPYAGLASLLNPQDWIGFFPFWLRNLLPANLLISLHSLSEIVLALWLLSGKLVIYSAGVSALAVLSIIIFNLGSLDIIFRDVAILFAALALVKLTYYG